MGMIVAGPRYKYDLTGIATAIPITPAITPVGLIPGCLSAVGFGIKIWGAVGGGNLNEILIYGNWDGIAADPPAGITHALGSSASVLNFSAQSMGVTEANARHYNLHCDNGYWAAPNAVVEVRPSAEWTELEFEAWPLFEVASAGNYDRAVLPAIKTTFTPVG